jgi:hypothetical protein
MHTWDPEAGRTLDKIRKAIPGVKIILGFGVDGIAKHVAQGTWGVTKGISAMTGLHTKAREVGAHAVVWNAEGGWKSAPNTEQRTRILALVNGALEVMAERAWDMPIWHTAYDHPASHSSYPWEAWLGKESPVSVSFCQVYAGAGEKVMAHRGKLAGREAASLASWEVAVKKGWVDTREVLWQPYYQLHHVPAFDTIRQGVKHKDVCLWAVPSRFDQEGTLALRGLLEIESAGGIVPWQLSQGLAGDGAFGPLSAKALGLPGF